MKLRTAFILVSYLFSITTLCAQNTTLQSRISDFLKNKKATVGVSVLTERGDTLLYNNNLRYPLLSVFKFHIALAVLDKMDHAGTPLDSILHISSSQLQKNTYSPLRDKYPNQDINISLRDLLKYSVSLSDNNACDILIDYAGGISKVDSYIRKLGIKNFHLLETENTMHQDPEKAPYNNWSYPSEATRLLFIADTKALFSNNYKEFLTEIMLGTTTGTDKLKGLLPPSTQVGHKTGSSDRNPNGMKLADNDMGFITLPCGVKYYIAIFVMNSYETDQENASIIAFISRLIYDELNTRYSNR